MRCKRCRFYTQLMLLVGAMTAVMPVSSHQLSNEAHGAVSNGYSIWHNAMHAIEACVGHFSSGYLAFLVTLLTVLAFVVIRVKRSDRVLPT